MKTENKTQKKDIKVDSKDEYTFIEKIKNKTIVTRIFRLLACSWIFFIEPHLYL